MPKETGIELKEHQEKKFTFFSEVIEELVKLNKKHWNQFLAVMVLICDDGNENASHGHYIDLAKNILKQDAINLSDLRKLDLEPTNHDDTRTKGYITHLKRFISCSNSTTGTELTQQDLRIVSTFYSNMANLIEGLTPEKTDQLRKDKVTKIGRAFHPLWTESSPSTIVACTFAFREFNEEDRIKEIKEINDNFQTLFSSYRGSSTESVSGECPEVAAAAAPTVSTAVLDTVAPVLATADDDSTLSNDGT